MCPVCPSHASRASLRFNYHLRETRSFAPAPGDTGITSLRPAISSIGPGLPKPPPHVRTQLQYKRAQRSHLILGVSVNEHLVIINKLALV